jgi:hypothetical protein
VMITLKKIIRYDDDDDDNGNIEGEF